ncbi:MAG: MOSC domain-containing protein [Neisseriaceae bacterium]|nr:MOSC domain-containing protein [Neisseriaceae bacterium]
MHITELLTYPLKSSAPIRHTHCRGTTVGLLGDRQFGLFAQDGHKLFSLRNNPLLAKQSVHVSDHTLTLTNLVDGRCHSFALVPQGEARVEVWRRALPALTYGEELNAFFSTLVGTPVLFAQPLLPAANTDVDLTFMDGGALHLVNRHSVMALGEAINMPFIDPSIFRPNLVIDDCPVLAENTHQALRINDVVFDVVERTNRCVAINLLAQALGLDTQPLPLKALKAFNGGSGAHFGVYLRPRGAFTLSLGDAVTVITDPRH